jgi:hypothetical protein
MAGDDEWLESLLNNELLNLEWTVLGNGSLKYKVNVNVPKFICLMETE